MDNAQRPRNPDFVLNQPRYQGASILLARAQLRLRQLARARAVGAADYGFRALIAPSYADIFFNNCYKNGLLPIVLTEVAGRPAVRRRAGLSRASSSTIDLERQIVSTPDGAMAFAFDVEPFRKHCLLNGLDDIGLTLQHADAIRAFEAKRLAEQPWLV